MDETLSFPSRLQSHGWSLIPAAVDSRRLDELKAAVASLAGLQDESVRNRDGAVYAARNVLDLAPQLLVLWRTPPLVDLVVEVCGPRAGLVRGLFFDKPPEQTWALPWHKDLLIAVANDRQCSGYSQPRLRAGVWHTQPPLEVLQSMLTLRIHLDDMTDQNGPLEVLSGSHATGTELRIAEFPEAKLNCRAGDVLAMRPLLVHASGRSHPECGAHRRVVHLEFSGMPELPGGAAWQRFARVHE